MMRAGQCSLICACALFFAVLVSSVDAFEQEGTYYYDESGGVYFQPRIIQEENVRGKRTLGIFLKSFADAIGYDVQKRPSVLPIGGAPVAAAPAAMAPAAPGPAAPAAPAPAAPAPVPSPGKPGVAAPPPPPPRAPAPKAPPPAPPARPAPAAPPAPPARPAPAAPPAKPAPAAPPAAPAPAPAAPAMPAAPAAAPKPAAPRPPTAPPLLTETIQKMFNINFNWNRNLQPKMPAAPAPAPPAPAPQAPPAAPPAAAAPPAPASQAPPAAPPAPPAAPPAAPSAPPAAPPAAPAPKGPPTKAPPTRYYQDLQENDYLDYPDRQQQIIYYPDENESLNQEDTKEVRNDYGFPEAIQQYWTQSPWNKNNVQYNIHTPAPDYQEFNTPDGGRGYHVRHYHRNDHIQHQDQPDEEPNTELQQQVPESNGQEQYQQRQQYQQEQYQQQQQQAPESNGQEQYQQRQQYQQEQYQQQQQQQPQQNEQNPEDVNGDDSKSYYNSYDNNNYQPRGFQPVYSESESRFQNNYYQPGLPLQVHGIQENKVLVAWPSPFELAGSEKKNKIAPYQKQFGDRMQGSGSENQEYKYEPESYGEYNFYTIPPPTKYQYENYDAPASDSKLEKEFPENAKVSESNYSKKYTNVNVDRNTYNH